MSTSRFLGTDIHKTPQSTCGKNPAQSNSSVEGIQITGPQTRIVLSVEIIHHQADNGPVYHFHTCIVVEYLGFQGYIEVYGHPRY